MVNKNICLGLIAGAAALYFAYQATTNYMQGTAAASWHSTNGTITNNGTAVDWLRKGYNLIPQVTYTYKVNGREYICDRISYPPPSSRRMDKAQKFLEKYPIKSHPTVYFDPKNPNIASLQRELNYDDMQGFLVLCGIFTLVSTLAFYFSGPEKWR